MSQNTYTSSYYRKSAFLSKILRLVSTFLFLLFLICCIVVFRDDLNAENIRLLAKYITLNTGSSSLYDNEFSVSAGENCSFYMLNDNLAIVKNNNISLYDLSGQKLFSYDYSYSSPAVTIGNRNILVYDISGSELSVFNSFSKIKTIKSGTGITCAYSNEKGTVVVSGENAYRSSLSVYNGNYNKVYNLLSSDSYITSATLSHDGKSVLCSTAEASEGSFDCAINIYDISDKSTTPKYTAHLSDELPISVGYAQDKNTIYAVTDSNIHFYSSTLKSKSSYKFNQSKVESYYISDDYILITERNNLVGNSVKIIGISFDGKTIFEFNVHDEISDIAIGKESFYALGNNSVFRFSKNPNGVYEKNGEEAIEKKYISVVCDSQDNAYLITSSKVSKLDFNTAKDKTK